MIAQLCDYTGHASWFLTFRAESFSAGKDDPCVLPLSLAILNQFNSTKLTVSHGLEAS